MNRKGFLFALIAFVGALVTGCGTGGGVAAPLTGRAVFNIVWLESGSRAVSRLIPLAANSIRIEIRDNSSNILDSAVLSRPNTSLVFSDLPVGNVSAIASTFASTDGTGNALSTNTVALSVVANQTATETVNMATTVTALVSDYSRADIFNGEAAIPVSISGRNADGDILPITTSALTWTSSNTGVVTVANEAFSYAGNGTASVTVLDTESNISVVVPVLCMDITTSGSTTVNVRGSQAYTATVLGPTDTSFVWSKFSGNGSINSAGLFTAPRTPGTTVLRVTSSFDTNRYKDITVTVQAGNASVTVQ